MVDPPPPASTSVGGGGSGDRSNPDRACRDPYGSLLNLLSGRGGPLGGEELGLGNPILPGTAGVRGGSGPRTGAGDIGRGQPGRNGASHALVIIRSGRLLLNQPTSIHLTG